MTRQISERAAPSTALLGAGRSGNTVAQPIRRASTLLFDTVADLDRAKAARFDKGTEFYGRFGTRDVFAFEEAVSVLEGAEASLAVPSGLAACVLPFVAFVKPGDHVLIADTAYEPARTSFVQYIARNNVEVEFYDPTIGAEISELIRPETRLIYLESPGSMTFEVQDIPAIAAAARARGVMTVCDNTWATGYFCRPLALGADISVQAATKYIVGHSDAMLGTLSVADTELLTPLRQAANWLGYHVSPDDVFLAARGLRTLPARLELHRTGALEVASWMESRPGIRRVIHPGLSSHSGHALWKRDFTGSTGLFAAVLDITDRAQAVRFVEALRHFGLGFSWGGFESLTLLGDPSGARTATRWTETGTLCRFHIGLEAVADLIGDLDQALASAGLGETVAA
ncbi:cystathionine beta-lyase [Citreicella sp. C3M06]|uniref:cystathionine beta-lyase n=1 Tax=Citreicella sp. C3M06 TaxID=2841564 RepID=UPI001C08B486|nr:cystathionine beta-lyase [Citreicella sp. C3M06]MBU2961643.1 cystathionine beta-lyase [Citreicella sp. C3M06]